MHEKIGIITDSTCDIPAKIVERFNIKVLPLRVLYSSGEFRDGIDITAQEIYDRLHDEVPTTSLPSPEEVECLFEKMKQDGFTHVFAIHLSSELSGTGQMIRSVAEQIDGITIKVIDSKSISMGLGFMVMETAKAIQKKMNFEHISKQIQSIQKRLSVFFVLETLAYLKKGGRIGKVSGTLGEFLQIKPIITVNDAGIYTTHTKVRGRRQSIDKLLTIAKEKLSEAAGQIAVCYGGAHDEAMDFVKKIEALELPNLRELIVTSVSPVIGVHTGPGTLGFAILKSE